MNTKFIKYILSVLLVTSLTFGGVYFSSSRAFALTEAEAKAQFEESREQAEKNLKDWQSAQKELFDKKYDDSVKDLQNNLDTSKVDDIANKANKIIDTEISLFDNVSNFFKAFGIFAIFAFVIFGTLVVGGIVFDVFMILDCVKRDFDNKNLWLVFLIIGLFTGIFSGFIAFAYYSIVKFNNTKKTPKNKSKPTY